MEAVLREEPDSAWEPFWDYDQETPLCFAARQLCDVKILDLPLDAKHQSLSSNKKD